MSDIKRSIDLVLLSTELHIVEQRLQDLVNSDPNIYKNKKLKLAINEAFVYISRINSIFQSKYSLGDADTKNMLSNYIENFSRLVVASTEEEMDNALEYYIKLIEARHERNRQQGTTKDPG